MKTLKGRKESLRYVSSDSFTFCPAGWANLCKPFDRDFIVCNTLFNQKLSNCPCIIWNIEYTKEYYWQAMNPFFE